jgi:rhodanese-related sulfurtransferase
MANKNIITVIGATIVASLCCLTPVLAVLAGSSSFASSFSWLAPYHNYLVGFTVLVLLYAWYDKLKPSKTIDCDCDSQGFFAGKTFLAMVTIFTVIMLTFPQWGYKVFDSAPTTESCATGVCDLPNSEHNTEEKKESQKTLPTLTTTTEAKACDTGSCPTPKENITPQTADSADLPVLHYMNDEANNPTEHGQVACSGTGYKELDDLMAEARLDIPEMAPVVLKRMIDNEEEFVLLDVREAIQRAEGEIYADEMLAIPRTNLEFEILNAIKDKGTTIVVYTRMGARSLFAAQSLKKLGYTHVYNLSAGLKGWVRAEYPYDNGLGTVKKVVDAE